MSTATKQEKPAPKEERAVTIRPPRLPYHPAIEERFGIDKTSWKALVEAIFPLATSTESVILALSYCRARNLDPFKRVVHIVPIWSKAERCMVDTIWPGIGELRTTAFRTGEYAGRSDTLTGGDICEKIGELEITYPEWAQVTVRRLVKGNIVDFVGPKVYWKETYATRSRDDDTPNEMWATRPRGQLDKCAEAAALRAAFPEEVGSDYIHDEVQHQTTVTVEGTAKPTPTSGLDELTEKLEDSREEPKPASTHIVGDPLVSLIDVEFSAALLACEQKTDVDKLIDQWFGENRVHDFNSEHENRGRALAETRKADIESTRGSKSNKQKELVK